MLIAPLPTQCDNPKMSRHCPVVATIPAIRNTTHLRCSLGENDQTRVPPWLMLGLGRLFSPPPPAPLWWAHIRVGLLASCRKQGSEARVLLPWFPPSSLGLANKFDDDIAQIPLSPRESTVGKNIPFFCLHQKRGAS